MQMGVDPVGAETASLGRPAAAALRLMPTSDAVSEPVCGPSTIVGENRGPRRAATVGVAPRPTSAAERYAISQRWWESTCNISSGTKAHAGSDEQALSVNMEQKRVSVACCGPASQ